MKYQCAQCGLVVACLGDIIDCTECRADGFADQVSNTGSEGDALTNENLGGAAGSRFLQYDGEPNGRRK